jgi:transposase/DNA-binding XRE family transcriptional regulator
MRKAPVVNLTAEQRAELERLSRGRSVTVRLAERATIVLRAADGLTDEQIGAELGVTRQKAGRWRKRFLALGVPGIEKDAPRPGRLPSISARKKKRIVEMTLHETPPDATHWSRASMGKAVGVSDSTVGRIWREHGLKPHLVRTFKLSNDKLFVEKLEDIVGLYLSPPEHAIVLSCDEKSQIQALDRTQPGLPMKKGRGATMTHDYKRNGTTTLFAALNVADGSVIGTCMERHRHQEWIKFLKLIDENTSPDRDVHIICDNYATHKHAKVKRWLARHPRFHIHFTPTSASWLNMVERFFRDISENSLRRGVFRSVDALVQTLDEHIARHNEDPKPFIWTATAEDILAKVSRARQSLHTLQSV